MKHVLPGAFALANPVARPRAVTALGVRADAADPKVMLAELVQGFEDFKAKQNQRDTNIQSAYDELNARVAAARLGGGVMAGGNSVADDPDYTTNFLAYARSGNNSADLMSANREGDRQRLNAALSTAPGEAGGYLAPTEWDRQIRKAQRAISPFRQIATVVQTSVRAYSTLWNVGGWGSGWVGETANRPVTNTADLKPLEFSHGEIYAFPMISQGLIDDADFPVEEWLTNEVAEEFERQEDVAFLSGDGVNKPRGFLTHVTGAANADKHPGGEIKTLPSGAAGEIRSDALVKLVYGLASPYRVGARWLMNSNTAAAVALMKDGQGNYLWRESFIVGQPATLLGYPVAIDESMPDVASSNTPIAFGDFKRGYVINDRVGVRVLRDPYTAKPFVGFYTTKRVGGGVLDPNAIRVLRIAAN